MSKEETLMVLQKIKHKIDIINAEDEKSAFDLTVKVIDDEIKSIKEARTEDFKDGYLRALDDFEGHVYHISSSIDAMIVLNELRDNALELTINDI